ncbi:MAG: exodeoxyribonuclease VII large subunit, partial [Gemmatimonadota bacterium]|nr:exodeoxyribonuclease VII large subunit [Gemmatimonadota bacterium]
MRPLESLASAEVLSVSELVLRASNVLVAELGTVAVEGEISSFHHHGPSGHMYWTLKDGSSEVRCAMFRRDNRRLDFPLADGERVVVIARPTIYRARGQFQLQVTEVLPRGRGALWLEYERLKKKLAEEGLFAEERKRRLPWWPERIGVVTSSEGAAVRDVCTVIHRRAPGSR